VQSLPAAFTAGVNRMEFEILYLNVISLLTLKGVFTFTSLFASFRLRDFTFTLSFILYLAGIRLESNAGIVRSNKPRRSYLLATCEYLLV